MSDDAAVAGWSQLSEALRSGDWAKARPLAERLMQGEGEATPGPAAALKALMLGGGFERLQASSAEARGKWLSEQIILAGQRGDRRVAERAAFELQRLLLTSGISLDDELAVRALRALRNVRAFEALAFLGDRLVALGVEEPEIAKLFAQGLIDSGYPRSAVLSLERMLAATPADHPQHADSLGLAGRAYKQIYVDASERQTGAVANAALRQALSRAVRNYEDSYFAMHSRREPKISDWCYPAINLIAVLSRARRDGISVHSRVDAGRLANDIIDGFGENGANATSSWDMASLGEAYVAREEWDKAEHWLRTYASDTSVTAFQLAGTVRQLEEVWGLKPDKSGPGRILYFMQAQLLAKEGGQVLLTPDARQRLLSAAPMGAAGSQPEAYLSDGRPKPIGWFRTGLERANSIGLVKHVASGRGFGTGFLVRGGDFIPKLGDLPVLLTNAHVISERASELGDPFVPATHTKKAKVEFTEVGREVRRREFTMREILWDSPRNELDACLVALHPTPEGIPLCHISQKRPEAAKSRVVIIGHPGGERDLKVSLFETPLVSIGPKGLLYTGGDPAHQFLRYTNPTVPGNSGSPVFEIDDWEVVGVHHAGPGPQAVERWRQTGVSDEPLGNEAVFIRSITETAEQEGTGRTTVAVGAPPSPDGGAPVAAEAAAPVADSEALQSARSDTIAMPRTKAATVGGPGPGKLAHDIPKGMKQGQSETVKVSLSRQESEQLLAGLRLENVVIHDVVAYAAMTLALRSPDGAFRIDPITSETQWLDRRDGRLEDVTTWKWALTPLRTGERKLLLVLQGHEFRDGLAAPLPGIEQTIPVEVTIDARDRTLTYAKWAGVAAGGGALSMLGQMLVKLLWE